jgi:ribosomal protein L11 methyltransferase
VIDPEGAFGSGLHPATEACLIALAELGAAGRLAGRASQLDVGVGSGILAIAGARRGLARVVGIDLEASARKAAEAAAALNDLSSVIKIVDDRLERFEERFDLVTANLEPHSVYTVVQALQAVTAPGGILVLGGFRHVDADAVAASYDLARTDLFASSDGEWGALVFEA